MAQWKKLRYGSALVAMGLSITATTIYVTGRWRIKGVDHIELMQATIERCLIAGIAIPQYTRTFTEYIYTNTVITNLGYPTTNTIIYTNAVTISNVVDGTVETRYFITTNDVVLAGTNFATNRVTFVITTSYSLTNALGYRMGRSYLNVLDPIIEALAPFYMDTNTVFDGTTNFIMHTFTGLLATLNLGDGTDFTPYGWRVSTNELRERYKVLEKYRMTKHVMPGIEVIYKRSPRESPSFTWNAAKSQAESSFSAAGIYTNTFIGSMYSTYTAGYIWDGTEPTEYHTRVYNEQFRMLGGQVMPDELFCNVNFFIRMKAPSKIWNATIYGELTTTNTVFDDHGLGFIENAYAFVGIIENIKTNSIPDMTNFVGLVNVTDVPNWCVIPTTNSDRGYASGFLIFYEQRGFQPSRISDDMRAILNWTSSTNGFRYATNSLN